MYHPVDPTHLNKLINLFKTAPIQKIYAGCVMQLATGVCTIQYPVAPTLFHGGYALHGSAYFKLLDDAAYFAAATCSTDFFLLTSKFEIKLLRPVTAGQLTAEGSLESAQERSFTATARLLNADGKPVALGSGQFALSTTRWENLKGYSL